MSLNLVQASSKKPTKKRTKAISLQRLDEKYAGHARGMPACFLPVLATDTMRVLTFVGRYLPILVSLAGRVWTE